MNGDYYFDPVDALVGAVVAIGICWAMILHFQSSMRKYVDNEDKSLGQQIQHLNDRLNAINRDLPDG